MSLSPNQQLSEYRIERILGRGAFGTVYLAHDTLLDRCALREDPSSGELDGEIDATLDRLSEE